MADAVKPDVVEEVKGEQEIAMSKLNELRKIKQVGKATSKLSMKNMYHDSFFYKILGMMDYYTSLALISPASLALVQQFADPQKLNILV